MKRTLCLLLAMVLITALFAGCAPAVPETSGTTAPTTVPTQPTDPEPTDPIPTDPEPTDPEPAPAEPQEIAFTYQSVGAPYDSWDIKQYTIRSREELEVYISEKIQAGNVQSYWDAVAAYDQDFFADHTLLVIYVYSHSVSVEWTINGVVLQPDGSYVVSIHSHCPLFYDMATANWNFLIAVDALIDENAQIAVDATRTEDTWDDMEPQSLNFTYRCIDTWPCLDSACGEPKLYVIDSLTALEAYCLEYASHVEGTYFENAIAAYNDDYFSHHTLIIISAEKGYQPIYFDVCSIFLQPDGSGTLHLKQMTPEWLNMASAGWHILVDVEGKLPEGTQFTLEIEEAPYEYDA